MTSALFIVLGISIAAWTWRHWQFHRGKESEPTLRATDKVELPSPRPFVSVCIPARDEEHNIPHTLDALLTQDYEPFEVIVVDDGSTDRTAEIVSDYVRRDARVRLIRAGAIPEGWAGKTNALRVAADEARGDILLFTDADVTLDKGALAVMTSYLLEHHIDMLSLLLRLDSDSFWEKAVRDVAGTSLLVMYPLDRVNDPKSPMAFATGSSIMIRAQVYHAVGGHENVRDSLLEDVRLAEHVKREGYRLMVASGFDMGECRMYSSLREHWVGWTRVFYTALDESLVRMIIAAAALLLSTASPYLIALYAAAGMLFVSAQDAMLTLLLCLSLLQMVHMAVLMARVARFCRGNARYAAMHFPATLVTFGIFLSVIWRRLSPRGLVWKGRRYDVR